MVAKIRILKKTIFICCLFIITTAFAAHKFYVAVYQLDYISSKKELQITARLFIDDIEKVLEQKYNKKLQLATPQENNSSNELVLKYLQENCNIYINGKSYSLRYVTKEYEDNVLIVYLKCVSVPKIKKIQINNDVLVSLFPQHQNMMHINNNGNKKSMLLSADNVQQTIEF